MRIPFRALVVALSLFSATLVNGAGTLRAASPGAIVVVGCNSGISGSGMCATQAYRVVAIAAGESHALGLLTGGSVVAWGCGIGTGGGFDYNKGQCYVPAGLSGVTAIAAGYVQSLAVNGDGTVVGWGCFDANHGQCAVPGGLSDVTSVAAGYAHSLALKRDGTVVAWGCGGTYDGGQCLVPSGLSGVVAVDAGSTYSLALKADGTVVAWGCGVFIDLGQCSVPAGLSNVVAVSAGSGHNLALKADGTVVAWGCSGYDYGQCTVPNSLSGVVAVAAGSVQSVALKRDGTVVAWGCTPTPGSPPFIGTAECSVPTGLSDVSGIYAADHYNVARLKASQTITFGTLPSKTYGDADFAMPATASSGLPVSFAATGVCTISDSYVHLTGAGFCTIAASQPGDGTDWTPAANVTRTFLIAQANQQITFGSVPEARYGDRDFDVFASSSSGLPVSLSATGSCRVSGVTIRVVSAGTCTLTASQLGNANYKAAPTVSRVIEIAKADQTIVLELPRSTAFSRRSIMVTARAVLPVSLAAAGRCTLIGVTLRITGTGTCTVRATQSGDANYNAAAPVSRTMTIAKAAQTIRFAVLRQRTLGSGAFRLRASTSSGLPLSFVAHGKCSVRGKLVHLLGPGSCAITAVQRGNANYKAARVTRRFAIVRGR